MGKKYDIIGIERSQVEPASRPIPSDIVLALYNIKRMKL